MDLDFDTFIKRAEKDDSIIKELFAKGIPVYYSMPDSDDIIKEYPDGHKEIICLDDNYKEYVIKTL